MKLYLHNSLDFFVAIAILNPSPGMLSGEHSMLLLLKGVS